MKRTCRELQERLAAEGAPAVRADAGAQRHLEECSECFQVLEGLARLDEALGAMPALDAPEPVVSELVARAAGTASEPTEGGRGLSGLEAPTGRPFVPRFLLWGFATAASVVLAFAVAVPSLLRARVAVQQPKSAPEAILVDGSDTVPPTTLAPKPADELTRFQNKPSWDSASPRPGEERGYRGKDGRRNEADAEKLRALGYVQSGERSEGFEAPLDKQKVDGAGKKEARDERETAHLDTERADDGVVGGFEGGVAGGTVGGVVGGLQDTRQAQQPVRIGGGLKAPKLIRRVEPVYPDAARRANVEGIVILEVQIGASGKVEGAKVLRSVPELDDAALEAVRQWVYAPTVLNGRPVSVFMTVTIPFRLPEPAPAKPGSSENLSNEPARAFLEERSATEGLSFQPANGYWANTYVPGDPALRLLRARLSAWDRSALQARAGFRLGLHDEAGQPGQPFDAPRSAALAVYLHADRGGLEGPGRMLVQVGLKGSARSGSPRPPMNVGLVLDLRGDVPVEVAADMRALTLAFSKAKEVGDRFSLIVAGRPGGVAIAPAGFKHGPLTVALDRLLTGAAAAGGLDLADAVAAAYREVSQGDDPDATLGSSAVVLVTGQSPGDSASTLADLARQGAVAGIPLSVVGVGSKVPLDELDRLALAGQGTRRVLEARSDAARLVEGELAAASNAVARAVRLRIRLAPGVRLVDVLGSRRLDEDQAQRVREAERSIDLRLARNLGIEADRGDDEDGIQVLIPAFHAGDAHAILLDVVAPGPGPIADVSVRYKDLVVLGNGVARASLLVPPGARAPGPLERNVVKNLLAFRLSQALACAASALQAGDAGAAMAQVEQARALWAGLAGFVPGLAGDPDMARDALMLGQYARLLAGGAADQGPELAHLADSLRYAGRLKLLPRPAPLAAGAL